MNDMKVAFISDIEYNRFMDKERLTNMVATINEARVDVLIFGGDIFNLPLTNVPDEGKIQEITDLLKSINAPKGKFAVLGEQDTMDETVRDMTNTILYNSDFEVLNNESIKIFNGTVASINLYGSDSLINGVVDTEATFANINANEFNILATHCPDYVFGEGVPRASLDLTLAGHSHSAQIYIPLLGSIASEEGAKQYNHGKHTIDSMILHVSNGVGTSTMDMRLFSPPQMLVYRLAHEEVVQPQPEPTPPSDPATSE